MHGRGLCRIQAGFGRSRPYNPRMAIDIDIAYVARLARIELSGEQLEHYGSQLEGILEHAARVQQLPTEGIEPTSHPLPMVNSFRPDEVIQPLQRDVALSQAPQAEDGYFRVPPTLEEE